MGAAWMDIPQCISRLQRVGFAYRRDLFAIVVVSSGHEGAIWAVMIGVVRLDLASALTMLPTYTVEKYPQNQRRTAPTVARIAREWDKRREETF
jgi:hypothetical protein